METQAMGSVTLGNGRRSLWAAEPELWCNTAECPREQLEGRPDRQLVFPAGWSGGT